jgi:hypothetical protein
LPCTTGKPSVFLSLSRLRWVCEAGPASAAACLQCSSACCQIVCSTAVTVMTAVLQATIALCSDTWHRARRIRLYHSVSVNGCVMGSASMLRCALCRAGGALQRVADWPRDSAPVHALSSQLSRNHIATDSLTIFTVQIAAMQSDVNVETSREFRMANVCHRQKVSRKNESSSSFSTYKCAVE